MTIGGFLTITIIMIVFDLILFDTDSLTVKTFKKIFKKQLKGRRNKSIEILINSLCKNVSNKYSLYYKARTLQKKYDVLDIQQKREFESLYLDTMIIIYDELEALNFIESEHSSNQFANILKELTKEAEYLSLEGSKEIKDRLSVEIDYIHKMREQRNNFSKYK